MPIITASVPTANGTKYVQLLCKHWRPRLKVDFSKNKGLIKFPEAIVALAADAEALMVTIEAEEDEEVWRLKGLVAAHLDQFAGREAPLKFDWSAPEDA